RLCRGGGGGGSAYRCRRGRARRPDLAAPAGGAEGGRRGRRRPRGRLRQHVARPLAHTARQLGRRRTARARQPTDRLRPELRRRDVRPPAIWTRGSTRRLARSPQARADQLPGDHPSHPRPPVMRREVFETPGQVTLDLRVPSGRIDLETGPGTTTEVELDARGGADQVRELLEDARIELREVRGGHEVVVDVE